MEHKKIHKVQKVQIGYDMEHISIPYIHPYVHARCLPCFKSSYDKMSNCYIFRLFAMFARALQSGNLK